VFVTIRCHEDRDTENERHGTDDNCFLLLNRAGIVRNFFVDACGQPKDDYSIKMLYGEKHLHCFCITSSPEEKRRVLQLFPNGFYLDGFNNNNFATFLEIPFVRVLRSVRLPSITK